MDGLGVVPESTQLVWQIFQIGQSGVRACFHDFKGGIIIHSGGVTALSVSFCQSAQSLQGRQSNRLLIQSSLSF